MSKPLKATKVWQSVTLTRDEIWEGKGVRVQIDTEAVEANRGGIHLYSGQSIQLKSGLTVYYRKFDDAPGQINRMGV